jgi:hypothetical protein
VALEKVTAALLNTHLRDNLSAAFPNGTGWTTYSPTLANLTKGSGTEVARYFQAGDFMAVIYKLVLAADSSVGSQPTVTMPATFASTTDDIWMGNCRLQDANGSSYHGTVQFPSTTTFGPRVMTVSGSNVVTANVTATAPFSWTTSDSIRMAIFGEIA